jgi:hypothetical protein
VGITTGGLLFTGLLVGIASELHTLHPLQSELRRLESRRPNGVGIWMANKRGYQNPGERNPEYKALRGPGRPDHQQDQLVANRKLNSISGAYL